MTAEEKHNVQKLTERIGQLERENAALEEALALEWDLRVAAEDRNAMLRNEMDEMYVVFHLDDEDIDPEYVGLRANANTTVTHGFLQKRHYDLQRALR
jgi:hypothetical protein